MTEEKIKILLFNAVKTGINMGKTYGETPLQLKSIMANTINDQAINFVVDGLYESNK
jgi:hypothetical protein